MRYLVIINILLVLKYRNNNLQLDGIIQHYLYGIQIGVVIVLYDLILKNYLQYHLHYQLL